MTGSATLDFGVWPGTTAITTVAVTGQGQITSAALIEAFVFPATTSSHSADEHIIDPPMVTVGSIVPGTGFTIYGGQGSPGPIYGQWNIAWVYVQ